MNAEEMVKLADFYMKMAKEAEEAELVVLQSYLIGYADGLCSKVARLPELHALAHSMALDHMVNAKTFRKEVVDRILSHQDSIASAYDRDS